MKTLAKLGLLLLPLGGLVTLYQVAYCIWMCSHPVYVSPEWKIRLVVRLTTLLVMFVLWLLCWRAWRSGR